MKFIEFLCSESIKEVEGKKKERKGSRKEFLGFSKYLFEGEKKKKRKIIKYILVMYYYILLSNLSVLCI